MKILNMMVLSALILVNTACASTPVNVKVHVVDDDLQPVGEAKVVMSFLLGKGRNMFKGSTDNEGYVRTTQFGQYGVSVSVTKDGYYYSGLRKGRGDQDLTLLLREKKAPIAMFAKTIPFLDIKRPNDIWIGYDFMKGDYLPPYGKGVTNDFDVKFNGDRKSASEFSYHLEVRFPNEGDGLVSFTPKAAYSDLKSDYIALLTDYQRSWKYYRIKTPGVAATSNMYDDRDYYLRIRSEMDAQGNVISAHYGKIYGKLTDMTFYINPTLNDRNVEFDIHKNLFKNLTQEEQVSKP